MSGLLFESFRLGEISLANRVVMAPMTRGRATNERLVPTSSMAEYYRQRAGAGLIITEGSWPNRDSIGYMNVPGIFTDEQVKGWRPVTDAVHQAGGRIFLQLGHCGGVSHPDYLNGERPLAPSAVNPNEMVFTPSGLQKTETPREMTIDDIRRTIGDYRAAAANAKAAGFDGVELHAGYLYLIPEFLNSATNLRTDEYGGSPENRARFVLEVVAGMIDVWGAGHVGIKLSPGVTSGLVTANEDNDATYSYLLERLNDFDIAYVHGWYFKAEDGTPAARFSNISSYFRKHYRGTLIVNGGLTKESASDLLARGGADLVSFGAPFVSNPDLVHRFQHDLPLATAREEFYYTGGDTGYIDYPAYSS